MSNCDCPPGSINIAGWCVGGAGSIAVPCTPGGQMGPISATQIAAQQVAQGATQNVLQGLLGPIGSAIQAAIPRIGLFAFALILVVIGFTLLR